jgi:transposase
MLTAILVIFKPSFVLLALPRGTGDGTVISRCMQRHGHEECLRFLNAVERAIPAGKLIHAVVDNYATHKHPKVKAWLARHPRWTFHFTPTFGSWLNAVETFFSALTRKRIRRGSFHSLVDSQAAIKRYLAEHNAHPKPFGLDRPARRHHRQAG